MSCEATSFVYNLAAEQRGNRRSAINILRDYELLAVAMAEHSSDLS